LEATAMKTVTLEIASREDVTRRALACLQGKEATGPHQLRDAGAFVEGADRQAVGIAEGHRQARSHDDPGRRRAASAAT
jgi:hypothetical protein